METVQLEESAWVDSLRNPFDKIVFWKAYEGICESPSGYSMACGASVKLLTAHPGENFYPSEKEKKTIFSCI